MKKYKGIINFIVFVLAIMQMASICFAKEMIKAGDTFYLIDENSDICKNELYDDGVSVRYFDEDGKMIVGWWKKPVEESIYFFSNKNDILYGSMVFGINIIDGFVRVFGSNGKLVVSKNNYVAPDGNTYRIDINGNVYDSNDVLLRDTSTARSDYYTDTRYYDDLSLNDKTLAEEGNISLWGVIEPDTALSELNAIKGSNNKILVEEKIEKLVKDKNIIISDKIK